MESTTLAQTQEAAALAVVLDAVAERLASRLLVLFERRVDVRALTLARLDLDTLRNLLSTLGSDPRVDKVRELAARVAEQLHAVTR